MEDNPQKFSTRKVFLPYNIKYIKHFYIFLYISTVELWYKNHAWNNPSTRTSFCYLGWFRSIIHRIFWHIRTLLTQETRLDKILFHFLIRDLLADLDNLGTRFFQDLRKIFLLFNQELSKELDLSLKFFKNLETTQDL